MEDQIHPETEVRPRRRRYSETYKREILSQLESASQWGEKAAILRREGLYDSTVSRWRQQMKKTNRRRRGRKPKTEEQKEIERLRAEVLRLKSDLDDANLIIDVQKKLCDALEDMRQKQTSRPSNAMPSKTSGNA